MNAEILHDALNLLPSDLITATDQLRSAPRKGKIHWARWVSIAACFAILLFSAGIFRGFFLPGFDSAKSTAGPANEAAVEMEVTDAEEGASQENAAAGVTGGQSAPDYSDLDTITLTPTGVPSEDEIPETSQEEAAPDCVISLADTQYLPTPLSADSAVNVSAKGQSVLIQNREALERYYQDNAGIFDMTRFYESCQAYDEAWFADHDLLLLRIGTDNSALQYQVTGLEALEGWADPTWELQLSLVPLQSESASAETTYWHILMEVEKSTFQPSHVILLQITEDKEVSP